MTYLHIYNDTKLQFFCFKMKIIVCLVAFVCLVSAKPSDEPSSRINIRPIGPRNVQENDGKEIALEFSVEYGNKGQNYKLLHEQAVYQPGEKDQIVSTTVEYKGEANAYITAILVESAESTKGGKPSIIKGGIGQHNVTVQVASEEGKDNNFTVYIYGIIENNKASIKRKLRCLPWCPY